MVGHGLQGGKERGQKGRGLVMAGEEMGESLGGGFLKGACLGESELEGYEVWSGWKFGDGTVSSEGNVWGVTLGVGSWVEWIK